MRIGLLHCSNSQQWSQPLPVLDSKGPLAGTQASEEAYLLHSTFTMATTNGLVILPLAKGP